MCIRDRHEACRVNTGSAPALGMHVSRPVYRVRVTAPFEVRLYVEKYLPDAHGVPFAEILDDAPNGDFDGNVPPEMCIRDRSYTTSGAVKASASPIS